MVEIKMKKVFAITAFTMFGVSLFAQSKNTVEEKTEVLPSNKTQEVSVSTEDKYTPESFFIINDKPVSREEYMNYLMKKEDKENTTPQ